MAAFVTDTKNACLQESLKTGGCLSSFWPDSNRRPTHYECVALPTALQKLLS